MVSNPFPHNQQSTPLWIDVIVKESCLFHHCEYTLLSATKTLSTETYDEFTVSSLCANDAICVKNSL